MPDIEKIKKISPVFICDETTVLIPAPFDHVIYENAEEKTRKRKYSPFSDYKTIKAFDKECYYTEDYNSKAGITSDYMSLSDGTIIDFDISILINKRIKYDFSRWLDRRVRRNHLV